MIEPRLTATVLEAPPASPGAEPAAGAPARRCSADRLEERIVSRTASLGVVGLGYVGLPLGLTFGDAGFSVTGIDVDAGKVAALARGRSHVTDVKDDELLAAIATRRLVPTTDWSALERADVVTICVPTPLRKTKDPDLTYVVAATEEVARRLRPGQLVILESTTYPGTTEELVLPRLLESGLAVGVDFFLAFSPERVDPGNPTYKTRDIPKVVGGVTPACTRLAALLYRQAMSRVVPVSCTRVAEMVKLLENTFRSVNIALVNEMALMCAAMGIDVWEVIDGAATKPFGFMPFYPGPGLGGHCIPIDPIYLQWRARLDGFEPQFIQLAQKINGDMPQFVVRRAMDLLNEAGKPLKGSRVHLIGVTYKKDISDVRESPAIEILRLLLARGAEVSYSDPFVPELALDERRLESRLLEPGFLAGRDLVMVVTDHSSFDYAALAAAAPLVLDTRNALAELGAPNVRKL
ncbi:MAG TPA: nucleotide sugar dehydrogenase [Thermoanaerobaculia bacterium]|nr:nucleotide sugar dehydrogenase [Thermoanaerobaculia bacterium]